MSDPLAPVSYLPPPPPLEPTAPAPRRRPRLVVGSVAVVLALVAGAGALVLTQGGGSADARPLALSFTPGRSESYAIHMTMQGQITSDLMGDIPMDLGMDEVVTWKVTSVDADGVATVEMTVDEMSATMDGVEMPSAAGATPPVELVIAPDGRILSAGGLALGGAGQTQGFGFPGMGQLTPILPDDGAAVAPGDTWDKHFSQDFPFGHGSIEYTATSTYERNDTVNGRDAAVIATDMTVPMDFTLDFEELLKAMGDELEASGATGIDMLSAASMAYSGTGTIRQTSFVDLGANELLKTESTGDFDISMEITGLADLGLGGAIGFTGTFTQSMERR